MQWLTQNTNFYQFLFGLCRCYTSLVNYLFFSLSFLFICKQNVCFFFMSNFYNICSSTFCVLKLRPRVAPTECVCHRYFAKSTRNRFILLWLNYYMWLGYKKKSCTRTQENRCYCEYVMNKVEQWKSINCGQGLTSIIQNLRQKIEDSIAQRSTKRTTAATFIVEMVCKLMR